MTQQLDLFADTAAYTWPEGALAWSGMAHWDASWAACDPDGSLSYWRCARDHGIDARCSVVFRLTHPVHRPDLPTARSTRATAADVRADERGEPPVNVTYA
jgi:hypothetical protein